MSLLVLVGCVILASAGAIVAIRTYGYTRQKRSVPTTDTKRPARLATNVLWLVAVASGVGLLFLQATGRLGRFVSQLGVLVLTVLFAIYVRRVVDRRSSRD